MAEGGLPELSEDSRGSRKFLRRPRAITRFVTRIRNRVRSGQGSKQKVRSEHSETIYDFAEDVEDDEEKETSSEKAKLKEHIYAEIQDIYGSVREKNRINISEDLWKDSDTWRQADKLIEEKKFEDAILLIEDYSLTQRQQLLMSECYLQLGRMRNAIKCIDNLEALMMSLSYSSLCDLDKLADGYITAKSYIRALILLSCLSKMFGLVSKPDLAVEGIRFCSYKCGREVIPMMIKCQGRLQAIATDLGLEMINDMLDKLRSVTGANSDIKAENEARCLAHIANCYFKLKNFQNSLKLYQQAVVIMKKQFGVNASKYGVFGDLLNNIGIDHAYIDNYSEAYAFYSQALEVYKVAEDWPNDDKKWEFIIKTAYNQFRAQKMLT